MNDCTQTENMISPIIHKGVNILADKAYDSNKMIDYIISVSCIAVIPSRKVIRDYDKEVGHVT